MLLYILMALCGKKRGKKELVCYKPRYPVISSSDSCSSSDKDPCAKGFGKFISNVPENYTCVDVKFSNPPKDRCKKEKCCPRPCPRPCPPKPCKCQCCCCECCCPNGSCCSSCSPCSSCCQGGNCACSPCCLQPRPQPCCNQCQQPPACENRCQRAQGCA